MLKSHTNLINRIIVKGDSLKGEVMKSKIFQLLTNGKKNTRTSSKTLSSREIEQELNESRIYDEYVDSAASDSDAGDTEDVLISSYSKAF